MSEVPDGIWVFQNGLWSRDYENYHPEPTQYIRKDVSDTLLKAEREKALREAAEVAGVKPRRGGKPVSGPHHAGLRDGREEAKRLVLALIENPAG